MEKLVGDLWLGLKIVELQFSQQHSYNILVSGWENMDLDAPTCILL